MKSNKQPKDKRTKTKSRYCPSKTDNRRESMPSNSTSDVHVSGDINDANYYFSNELLKLQLSNISFNEFTGVPVNVFNYYTNMYETWDVPSTMVFHLNPSAGFTDESTGLGNALNLVSLKLYTQLSANNAKTTAYAPQDITTLFLALGSAISLTSHITRMFGLAYLYSPRNRSYPKALIEALGVDYDDLMSNFANYRARFNTIMTAASSIAFPSNVAYFKKCSELYSGIYLDMEGSAMAQTYAFVPYSVWLFDETGTDEGTVLETFRIATGEGTKTMNVLLSTLDSIFSALLSSSTLNTIYADILRLSDKQGMALYKFTSIPDEYVVLPAYNPEIRKWINNLSIMGEPLGADAVGDGYTKNNNVYPDADTNKIVYRPQFKALLYTEGLSRVLNFDYGTYTPDDIVNATRLSAIGTYNEDGTTSKVALPDHYVVKMTIHTPSGEIDELAIHSFNVASKLAVDMTAFDWSPILPTIIATDSGVAFSGFYGDLNYYTFVDYKYLSTLQDATYFGLFEIR